VLLSACTLVGDGQPLSDPRDPPQDPGRQLCSPPLM
jgi:hypothetical protein